MSKYLAPTYMIIGGVKCGTSSLYRYLNSHPQVLPCKSKEPNYFSFRPWYQIPFTYARYRRMFPLKSMEGKFEAEWLDLGEDEKMHASTFSKSIQANKDYITGEATATTFFAANPRVIKWLLPDLKLIMLLREPTERYVSHYRMYERFKQEGRKGYDFKPLPEYIADEIAIHRKGKKTRILHQGLYTKYLSRWESVFGKKNLLVLRTQDFEETENAQKNMERICQFLELPACDFREVLGKKFNRAKSKTIPAEAKQLLDEFYLPANQQLEKDYTLNFL